MLSHKKPQKAPASATHVNIAFELVASLKSEKLEKLCAELVP